MVPRALVFQGTSFCESDNRTLVRAVVARDPRAQHELWRRYAPVVSRILKRLFGPSHDVEDLAQDIFLCIFEKVPSLRDPNSLKAFIISITLLTSRGERRRLATRGQIKVSKDPDIGSKAVWLPETDAREAVQRFYRILDRVSAQSRALFVLRYVEELKLSQIAQMSGTSLATTKRRLTRAWSRFRMLVERDPILAELVTDGSAHHAESS